jgi:transposase-like protein
VDTTVTTGRRRRRHHSVFFKAEAVGECQQPGVSIAAVALARGLNANLLRRWVKEAECTISRNGPARFRVNGPTLHGLPAEPRFESSTRPFSLRQVFWL